MYKTDKSRSTCRFNLFKNIKEIQLLKKKLYKYKWANKPTHAR